MNRLSFAAILLLLVLPAASLTFADDGSFWPQWGRNPQHTGMVNVSGQPLNRKLADIIYDPFTQQEQNENYILYREATLTVHYQATLVDDNSFFMMQKSGSYPSCAP